MATSHETILEDCQQVLQYQFQDQKLLKRCLTHASVAETRLESNERLEFFGDAILGMVVSEMLYHLYPGYPEGELTRLKSILVSRNTCAQITEKLEFEKFLFLGKGLALNSAVPLSIMAAVYESLIAGIYLDGGLEAARTFIERTIEPELVATTDEDQGKNYKSLLQQFSQKSLSETPFYKLLDEKGPDHSKCFQVSAVIGSHSYSAAWGMNKKEAEQRAAENALKEIAELESLTDAD